MGPRFLQANCAKRCTCAPAEPGKGTYRLLMDYLWTTYGLLMGYLMYTQMHNKTHISYLLPRSKRCYTLLICITEPL